MWGAVVKLADKSAAWWFGITLAAGLALELASFSGWVYPGLGTSLALALAIIWLIVAARNLPLGIALLVVELILNSQGYLFSLRLGETVLSLRLLLFLAAAILIVWRVVVGPKLAILSDQRRWWYLATLAALAWGSTQAWWQGNAWANFFLDLNGYLYLGLWPLWLEAGSEPSFITWLKRLAAPAIVWLGLKTLLALYLFSHFMPESLLTFYQWWRQTGWGEITYVSGSFFRIFSQSHIWVALASAAGLVYLWRRLDNLSRPGSMDGGLVFLWFSLVILLASFSRSFWLGTAVVGVLVPLLSGRQLSFKKVIKYYAATCLLVLAAAGSLIFITKLNWPIQNIGVTSANVFSQRLGVGEAAGQSRLKLLGPLWSQVSQHWLLGAGLGSTVTYYSSDPRLVKATAGGSGQVTTYAFEWGYLDAWLKFGLLGLLLFLAFMVHGLYLGFTYAFKSPADNLWPLMALAATVALLVVNVTTPYLNHPLGLGAIMLAMVLIYSQSGKIEQPV